MGCYGNSAWVCVAEVLTGGQQLKPILLQCKTMRVENWHWLRPPTPQFCIGGTNMLVPKNAKICVNYSQRQPPTRTGGI